MKTILKFIDVWGLRITTILVFVVFLKTCTTNGKINKIQKQIETTNKVLDSNLNNIRKEIKIEGLRSEKRMIQSTDRKIMDVNRQSQLDQQIDSLEND